MISRRTMLASSAAVGAVSFVAMLPGLRAVAQATPPLHRSLKDMDLDDPILITLREFVRMMQDPSRVGQPVSWIGFSDIHGSFAVGFNKCPHGNWYFLPWHRSYVRMYEVAARALTGDQAFAMPYWDWTEQPDFPAAFGDDAFDGQPNPLFLPGRSLQTGDALSTSVTGQAVMDRIYASLTLEEFGSSRAAGQDSTDPMWIQRRGTQGELEFNPHNNVHCDVAGPFMCSGASPQDPIFQMHHCNIDRIWAEWISRGRANSTDPLWLDMPFTDNFFDPDGNPYTDVVNELLEVVPLGYTYGLEQPVPPPPVDPGRYLYLASLYGAPLGLEAGLAPLSISDASMTATPKAPLSISLSTQSLDVARAVAPSTALALETAGLAERRVYAFVRSLEPANGETTQLRVFVNLPDANGDTSIEDNPNFVTTIGFFGPSTKHDDQDMRPSVAVDLTPALRRLAEDAALATDEISLQLVPVARHTDAAPGDVMVAEVELAIV